VARHALIKQGAKLVETAQDVLEELKLGQVVPGAQPGACVDAEEGAGDAQDPLLAAMGYEPVSQEALSARTGWGPAALGARLMELELMGEVARLPGALFQRRGQA
jgi:DNA processing protein